MKDITFITGNQNKADYLAKWLDMPIAHQKVELDELQSLDPHTIAEHKVRQAYAVVKKPVLVEDVALTFHALGRLPGTLVKWFLEEVGNDGLCKLLVNQQDRSATASIVYALFDGRDVKYFEAAQSGLVAEAPRGDLGFGWNAVFIPEGAVKTYAEMTDDELKPYSFRAQAIEKLKAYLTNQQ